MGLLCRCQLYMYVGKFEALSSISLIGKQNCRNMPETKLKPLLPSTEKTKWRQTDPVVSMQYTLPLDGESNPKCLKGIAGNMSKAGLW